MPYRKRYNKYLNNTIITIILFMSSNLIQPCFRCCDEKSVKTKNQPNFILKAPNSELTGQNLSTQNSLVSSLTGHHNAYATTTTFTMKLAQQKATSNQFVINEKSIFSQLNLEALKIFFLNIEDLVDNQYDSPKNFFKIQEKDSSNKNEAFYLINENYRIFFDKHLSFISEKFMLFIDKKLNDQNLNTTEIEKLAIEQIIMLDNFLIQFDNQITYQAHNKFIQWLKQIAQDQIRETNITLEYMQSYIKESILPIIPSQGFQKNRLSEYKKLLLEKVMVTDTQSEEIFNKKIIIQKLLQKNAYFIHTLENIFTDLFLEKVKSLEAKPSAEAENCMPHAVND